ncbi:MAG: GDSL-type esterase/lipase family protein [Anaerolineaceae bacterium]|nr:GDSL-type esterase/lipase family protein [Anaerolineaceae bacterium]
MKIVFYGDELLPGLPGACVVDEVAAGLRGHRFILRGRLGDTSLNLYQRLEEEVLAHDPEAVFVMAGLHDAISQSEAALRPWYRWQKGLRGGRLSAIACRENLRAILEILERHNIRAWVATPPAEYRPSLVAALEEVNAATRQLCEELHVPNLNLQGHMTPESIPSRPPLQPSWLLRVWSWQWRAPDYERLRRRGKFSYTCDGLHPTPDGARVMAQAIVDFLREQGLTG